MIHSNFNHESGINNNMSEEPKISPTIEALDKQRGVENLFGSPLSKQKRLFGKEYDFYQDGSVLVVDPANNVYHFLTAEGQARGSELRGKAKELTDKTTNLQTLRLLGQGKGGFSNVYELPTDSGPVAVKVTDGVMFFFKEMMEEATSEASMQTPLEMISGRMGGGKQIVQRMSLRDTVQLFRKLDTARIRRPEFYGFTVRRNVSSNEIQEFQFMEAINRPTIESVLNAASDANVMNGGAFSEDSFPYAGLVNEMTEKYYGGDQLAFMRVLVRSFISFVADTKRAIPNIADLEMDNIFLAGYDEEDQRPEFLLIDPIEEQVYLRPIQLSGRNPNYAEDKSVFKENYKNYKEIDQNKPHQEF